MPLIALLLLHRRVMHNHFVNSRSVYTQAQTHKNKAKIPIILFLCALVFLVAVGWFILTRVFVVKTIHCTMDGENCPESVLAEVQRLQGKPLYFLQTSQLKSKIMGAFPQLISVESIKKFPSTVDVILISSKELLVVYLPENNMYAFLSSKGKVLHLTPNKPEQVLFITLPNMLFQSGEDIDAKIFQDVVQLLKIMHEHASILTIERVSSNEIYLYLPNNKRGVVSSDGLEKQVDTLQLLLNEATMIENISVMDLRFSHPVLR